MADQASDDKLLRLFADGATIVLQGLHRTWEPVLDFTQDLAADLGHPVQVNAYVTPAQNTGFSDHYDVHDVFVLQVAGEKRWRIREPVHPSPLRDQPWTDRKRRRRGGRRACAAARGDAAARRLPLSPARLPPRRQRPRRRQHAPHHRRPPLDPAAPRRRARRASGQRRQRGRARPPFSPSRGRPGRPGRLVGRRRHGPRGARPRASGTCRRTSSPPDWSAASRQAQRAAPVSPVATVRAAAGLDGTEHVT